MKNHFKSFISKILTVLTIIFLILMLSPILMYFVEEFFKIDLFKVKIYSFFTGLIGAIILCFTNEICIEVPDDIEI